MNHALHVTHQPLRRGDDGSFRLDVSLETARRRSACFVRWGGGSLAPPDAEDIGNALLCLFLMPAMALGVPLRVEAPVCPRLLDGARRSARLFAAWFPDRLADVPIECPLSAAAIPAWPAPAASARFSSCFSAGVDSFFTLRRHRERIGRLVYLHGFDVLHRNEARRRVVAGNLRTIADACGVPLVLFESDMRDFSDPLVNHTEHHHGAILAALGHLLRPVHDRLLIPSSNDYRFLFPYGSHPMADPLWSSRRLEIVHDGSLAHRTAKLESLLDDPVARNHLRVCAKAVDQLNCGRCEKCLRTMAILRMLRALGRFPVFPSELDLAALGNAPLPRESASHGWELLLEEAVRRDADEALIDALRAQTRPARLARLEAELRPRIASVVTSPGFRRLWPKIRTRVLRSMMEADPAWFARRLFRNHFHRLKEPVVRILLRRRRARLGMTGSPGRPTGSLRLD